jgi:hypothetical protein
MYPVCDDSRLKTKAYRKVLIGNYILIFRIEKSARGGIHITFLLWCSGLSDAIVNFVFFMNVNKHRFLCY